MSNRDNLRIMFTSQNWCLHLKIGFCCWFQFANRKSRPTAQWRKFSDFSRGVKNLGVHFMVLFLYIYLVKEERNKQKYISRAVTIVPKIGPCIRCSLHARWLSGTERGLVAYRKPGISLVAYRRTMTNKYF